LDAATSGGRGSSGSILLALAAFVVIVAGLRTAQTIVVPFVVAAFLAMICLPPLKWLQDKGLPVWLALVVIFAAIVVVGLLVVGVVGNSISELREQLPVYERRVAEIQADVSAWLNARDINVGFKFDQEDFDAQRALSLFGSMLGAVGAVLSNALVILFTLVFILLEAADFPAKLRAVSGGRGDISERVKTVQASVRRYVSIKTSISLLNGVLVAVWLWLLGVDFPLLWGLLTFLLNFVPNIGSFLAAAPAVALAFLQFGLARAGLAAAGYVALETVVGNVLEPRVMGRGLGISPLVVFLSLVFWGWVLGPVGMLFSVPLTMIVKIVLDNTEDLKWIGILLGSETPKSRGAKGK
jgi:predicted PurR-regulated permease PerM